MPSTNPLRCPLLTERSLEPLTNILGVLCAVIIMGSVQCLNATIPKSKASRIDNPSSIAGGRRFDCTRDHNGKEIIQRAGALNKEVKEGIDEARKALQTCRACWNLIGAREDP